MSGAPALAEVAEVGSAPNRSGAAFLALLGALARTPADATARVVALEPAALRCALGGFLLRCALALGRVEHSPVQGRAARDELRAALAVLDPYLSSMPLESPELGRRDIEWSAIDPALSDRDVEILFDAVTDRADGERRARDPGELHQELLATGLVRLDAASVCLAPDHVWVSCREMLREPPAARSKWLQRRAGLAKSAVGRLAGALAKAEDEASVIAALARVVERGSRAMPSGSIVVTFAEGRRRSGSHYTPEALRRRVVERTLEPLLPDDPDAAADALRVCDPAMGSGDFLVEVARYLALRAGNAPGVLVAVVRRSLYGVDKDPVAVDLARLALLRLAGESPDAVEDIGAHLRCGDAVVGGVIFSAEGPFSDSPGFRRFDWPREFPDVFATGGFDACIGNPPWVAYAGRAAQPLEPALHRYYAEHNPAFFGYRTLHGLFVRRAAELVHAGGRVGLVLPTSVSDLEGYRRTRAAHDALADADPELTDFGDGAFDSVFQPCMLLTSTRRSGPPRPANAEAGDPWSLARTDLDAVGTALLLRLSSLPSLDPALFGERGFQTMGDDLSHLRALPEPTPPFTVPIREGTDVAELERRPPRLCLDPLALEGKLRAAEEYRRVEILIRQTARYPIAALSDGLAFRNSVLAGFSNTEWSAAALVAYLNSSAVRFYHYVRHRDARQGMPQLKIGHLRAIPTLPDAQARQRLGAIGAELGGNNRGISKEERAALDAVVFDALGFSDTERALVEEFAREHRPPEPRGKRARSS